MLALGDWERDRCPVGKVLSRPTTGVTVNEMAVEVKNCKCPSVKMVVQSANKYASILRCPVSTMVAWCMLLALGDCERDSYPS